MNVNRVRADLIAEQQALDAIAAGLADDQWATTTPSPGWTVADQIGHLAYFDCAAATAITDHSAFMAMVTELIAAASGGSEAADDFTLRPYRAMEPLRLLDTWRKERRVLADASNSLDDDTRVDWYGPSMGAKSFLTARLMEAWAHGQDIVDAIGVTRRGSARLRHIAQLGFITRGWSYSNRGLATPDDPVRVELTAPSGVVWSYGPTEATEVVSGPAEDFCLVVTQRRHVDDTALEATSGARDWMLKAQAFAGPPTDGPSAGSRP